METPNAYNYGGTIVKAYRLTDKANKERTNNMRQVWKDWQNENQGIELIRDCTKQNTWEVVLYSMYGKRLEHHFYYSKESATSSFYRIAKREGIKKA